jgi:putative peptidoglycan lipid II flippase
MALYRAFATVGGLTLVSRVLGFARDILIAAVLGSGAVADAFFVAFRFPNLFRRLFGEGAFNAAFVPLFAKRLEGEGEAAAKGFAEEAMAALSFVLVGFSALAMLAMPWLMLLLAPGFVGTPEKYDLAVLLTQIAFPYLLCMSLVALLSGVLNSLHRFWVAAAAPIVLNLVLITAIAAAGWLGFYRQPQAGVMLAWGVFVAGFAQLAMLWVAVRRVGLSLAFRRPRLTDGVRRLLSLGIPGLVAGGITQINIVIGTIIASLQAGAVSYLYYADRLYQLPLGIVGVAIGVVLLPDLARKLRAGDGAAAMDSQNRSLELGLLLTLPAAVALAIAAAPIIRVLFERGAFDASDTSATAAALAAFAVGLPSFVLIKVFQPAFFAREDTATPMRFAAVNMVANALGSAVFFFLFREMGAMPHVGIALATSLAGWLNAALLWLELRRRGHFEADSRLKRAVPFILLSSFSMGVVLGLLAAYFDPWLATTSGLVVQTSALCALVAVGAAVYFLIAQVAGVARLDLLRNALRRQ